MSALADVLARCVSPARRASIEAARAEAHAATSEAEARRWRSAARTLLVRGLVAGPVVDVTALTAVIAAVVLLNSSTSDVASQETLVCIVLGSAFVGFLWGRRPWLVALLVGGTVAAQHLVSLDLHLPEPGVHLPAGWLGTASLLILVLPALLGAYAGARFRRLATFGAR
jgi:hypothetical protein